MRDRDQPLEMLLGQPSGLGRPHQGDAVHGRDDLPHHDGDLIERPPGQAQLARPVDPTVARQDLLDQGRARPRQAEDEDRLAGVQAGAGQPGEEVPRSKARTRPST